MWDVRYILAPRISVTSPLQVRFGRCSVLLSCLNSYFVVEVWECGIPEGISKEYKGEWKVRFIALRSPMLCHFRTVFLKEYFQKQSISRETLEL